MELKGKKINFLGDSITEGGAASCRENRYTEVIEREAGIVMRNYGLSGTRFAKQHTPSDVPSFDLDFPTRAREMDRDADAIVIFGGTNDFGHGDAELGTPADRTYETFYGACHQLFGYVRATWPRAKILVLTPLHRLNEDDPRGDGNKPHDVGTLKDYVEIIRQVAEFYSLPVLDLYKNSGLTPRVPVIREMFMPDGLHPSNEGHRMIAEMIIKALQAL